MFFRNFKILSFLKKILCFQRKCLLTKTTFTTSTIFDIFKIQFTTTRNRGPVAEVLIFKELIITPMTFVNTIQVSFKKRKKFFNLQSSSRTVNPHLLKAGKITMFLFSLLFFYDIHAK